MSEKRTVTVENKSQISIADLILLALLLNELRAPRYSRVLQTVYTFPNFLSWIIVSGIML